MPTENELPVMVIPKEDAVFWMDRFGRWCNDGGPFRNKKIIDYFNAAIRKDEHGFFVEQVKESVREKVYFKYEDTPLFVVDIILGDSIDLILNTKEKLTLNARDLFIEQDVLYLQKMGDRIKFTDRVLFRLAEYIESDGPACFIRMNGIRYPIAEKG